MKFDVATLKMQPVAENDDHAKGRSLAWSGRSDGM
jgi:hypothetical protein